MNIEIEELTKKLPQCPKCAEIIPERKFYHQQLNELKKTLCSLPHAFELAHISKLTEENRLIDYEIDACKQAITYVEDPYQKMNFKKGVEDEILSKSKDKDELESNLEQVNKILMKISIIEQECLHLEQTVLFFIQAFEKHEKANITKWRPQFNIMKEKADQVGAGAGTASFFIQKSSTLIITEGESITTCDSNGLTEDDILLTQSEMAMPIPEQCEYMFNLLKNPKGFISLTNTYYIGHKSFKDKEFRKKIINKFGKPNKGLNSEAFKKMLSNEFGKYIPEIFAETVITHKARLLKGGNLEHQ
jgi:hypothetical protein